MRNKGAIILLAILLALVCLYHLSFTFVVWNVERNATAKATTQDSLNTFRYDSIIKEKSSEAIWLWRFNYRDCKEQEINLGLDLKGGMNVVLEISVVDVINSLAGDPNSPVLRATIKRTRELQGADNADFMTLFGQAFKELYPDAKLAMLFVNKDNKKINSQMENDEVLTIITQDAKGAIDNSFNILRKRIDRFGVTQPNVQRLEGSGRILVELPGIKDQARVRNLLQGTASLEFWTTYENSEAYNYLIAANQKIVEMKKMASKDSTASSPIDSLNLSEKKDSLNTDSNIVDLLSPPVDSTIKDSASNPSLLEQLEKDTASEITDAASQMDRTKEYPLFMLLRPSFSEDNRPFPGAVVGTCHYKDTAQVGKYFRDEKIRQLFPPTLKFKWGVKGLKQAPEYFQLYALKSSRGGKPALEGDVINDARQSISQTIGSAEVNMQMNAEGTKVWKVLTKEAAGNPETQDDNKQIAVVLDGYVYSCPTVNGEIPNGSSVISGDFTIEEAKDLANVLKSGKMPAPATIISEEVVGPTLGADNINAGLLSFIIAFVIVLIYMIFYYNKAGWVANIALIANVFFIMGVLASLGAVLTMPGIAGIVLTLGMAVDANVLIYERIREEMAAGKGLKLAIQDGYKNAYSAIIDANVTTILVGVVLYTFGTGPIQGFATTLIIGILTSLFSAIFITRLIFLGQLKRNKNISFSTSFTENAFKNIQYKFLEKRKMFYVLSSIVIVIGVGSLVFRGLDTGVDFQGGRSYIIQFAEGTTFSTEDIKKDLSASFEGITPEVKTFGSGTSKIKITTKYLINEETGSTDSLVETRLYDGLKPTIGPDVDFAKFLDEYRIQSFKVGPTIVDEMVWSSIWAVLFSLVIIFIYILIRFRNWQFGLGALIALVHDVLIILGVYSLFYSIMPFSMELDQAFIAALLTVVGYSINDTVVIFDRLREYLGLYKKRDRAEVMNLALNSTLSRTFSTSFTTFIVLLAIFVFGGDSIKGFIFALLVGIVVGTYSSLFVATPIVYDTVRKKEDVQNILKAKKKI